MDIRRATALILAALTLTAALAGAADTYRVRSGDSLSLIARLTGSTVGDLRRANGIRGDLIRPDQRLAVPDAFSRTPVSAIRWRHPCPAAGETLRGFGPERNGRLETRRTGVDISAPLGTAVTAPANGVIRYLGEQDGYGTIVIVEHGAGFATVLGPFASDTMDVQEGTIVLGGDRLGAIGTPVEGNRPYLHVELRRHNEAIDPARLLR